MAFFLYSEAVYGNYGARDRLFFCGLRLGEFISLQVLDANMEKQTLVVRGETSKSKRTRSIPINPTALFHLKEYKNLMTYLEEIEREYADQISLSHEYLVDLTPEVSLLGKK